MNDEQEYYHVPVDNSVKISVGCEGCSVTIHTNEVPLLDLRNLVLDTLHALPRNNKQQQEDVNIL